MAPSVQFNVLRYSLFGAGIAYGFIHRFNLESEAKKSDAAAEYKHEEKLQRDAKKAWAKLHPPAAAPAAAGSINWEDPNLDIGAALELALSKLE